VRRLVESTFVTLDGVISSPDIWGSPYWDTEHATHASKLLFDADALLLGRVTYEGFATAWPGRHGEYANRINELPKYVASRSLPTGEVDWNATVLGDDPAGEIAELKQEPGQNILKFGTGELDRLLMRDRLIDEFHLWVFPVIGGGGLRLFDGFPTTHLDLVDAARFGSGITVLTLVPKSTVD
jgi:dihydrofolate reductase